MTEFNPINPVDTVKNKCWTMIKGAASTTIVATARQVLNMAVRDVTPAQLHSAIQENRSLLASAKENLEKVAARFPPSVISAGRPVYLQALAEYGNTTDLMLTWLNQNHPALYLTIISTDGGLDWFDRQVREICEKFGLDYEVK